MVLPVESIHLGRKECKLLDARTLMSNISCPPKSIYSRGLSQYLLTKWWSSLQHRGSKDIVRDRKTQFMNEQWWKTGARYLLPTWSHTGQQPSCPLPDGALAAAGSCLTHGLFFQRDHSPLPPVFGCPSPTRVRLSHILFWRCSNTMSLNGLSPFFLLCLCSAALFGIFFLLWSLPHISITVLSQISFLKFIFLNLVDKLHISANNILPASRSNITVNKGWAF